MSPADKLAVRVKSQPILKQASGISIGRENFEIIRSNPAPCDPPDFHETRSASYSTYTFCGLNVVHVDFSDPQALNLIVPVPLL